MPAFEQAFKNIDDVVRKEAGCTSGLNALDALKKSLLHQAFSGQL